MMNHPLGSKKLPRSSGRQYGVPNPQSPYSPQQQQQQNQQNQHTKILQYPSLTSTSSYSAYGVAPRSSSKNLPPLNQQASAPSVDNFMSGNPMQSRSHMMMQISDKYIRHESVLEAFLVNTMTCSLHAAIEQTIKLTLKAETVTFWQDIPSLHTLYSDRISTIVSHSVGLVGYTFFSREVVKTTNASSHASYNEEIDGKVAPGATPVLLFPLWDSNNNVCGVVEVTRDAKKSFFDSEDEDFIQFFIQKFKIYSYWLFKVKHPNELCIELMQVMELEQFLLVLQRKISGMFECRSCEVWRYNATSKEITQYKKGATTIENGKSGIAGEAMIRESPINCAVNKMQSSYFEAIDGSESEAVLVVPLLNVKQNMKYAVALRGKKRLSVFTSEDEKLLRDVAPYIVLALDNNEKYSHSGIGGERNVVERQFVNSFKKLVDNLSSGTKISDIVSMALEQVETIVNSDRSMLFTYNKDHNELQTIASTGLNGQQLHIGADRGVVGQTYREGKSFNIPDAYDFMGFDFTLDLETGYKTQALVSVPVYNNRREIIAVAQFMNKKDGKPFSNLDISNIEAFITFCGMMMENEKMYHQSSKAKNELSCFIDVLKSLSSNDPMKKQLENVINNSKKSLISDRSSLFFMDNVVNVLSCYISDEPNMPPTIPLKHGIAAISVGKKKPIIVNDAYHDAQFNKMIDYDTKYKTNKVIAAPIISSTGVVYGVLEMVNKNEGIYTEDDLIILESYASIASSIIEKDKLRDISEHGTSEVEMMKWIGDLERSSTTPPTKLAIPLDRQNEIRSFSFNSIEWNGIGLFKIAFLIFNEFGLLEKFSIRNDLFFSFLFKLRELYNDVPYHNWIHAVDVLQLYAQQMKVSHLDELLTGLELLAICVAAISHDVGHQGFTNSYHTNARTPYGIMYKDQSVTELTHCTAIINLVVGNAECNIFHAIPDNDQKNLWNWIINMILSTDISLLEQTLKKINNTMDEGPINLSNQKHRVMAMTLLMNVANLGNVTRPFDIASQWCDALMEEYWRQGDLEKEIGLDLSNPLNERDCDKETGQLKFIQKCCLPLFQLVSRIFPELEINIRAVENNIKEYKERITVNEIEKKRKEALSSRSTDAK